MTIPQAANRGIRHPALVAAPHACSLRVSRPWESAGDRKGLSGAPHLSLAQWHPVAVAASPSLCQRRSQAGRAGHNRARRCRPYTQLAPTSAYLQVSPLPSAPHPNTSKAAQNRRLNGFLFSSCHVTYSWFVSHNCAVPVPPFTLASRGRSALFLFLPVLEETGCIPRAPFLCSCRDPWMAAPVAAAAPPMDIPIDAIPHSAIENSRMDGEMEDLVDPLLKLGPHRCPANIWRRPAANRGRIRGAHAGRYCRGTGSGRV